MKGLLVFLLLLSSSLRAQEPIITPTYIQFAKDFDTFNRKIMGCPLEPDNITKEDCFPNRGIIDLKLWKKLNAEAKKIFNVPSHRKGGKGSSRSAE